MAAEKLWAPRVPQDTQMFAFLRQMSAAHGFAPEWDSLRQWSIDQRGTFWQEIANLAGIEFSQPATAPCERSGTGPEMLSTRWFPGARLNYARHLLRFDDDGDAILFEGELGQRSRMTFRELRGAVAGVAASLRADGVKAGDRVAGYLPNIPETVIAMLAAASLGAIWSSCSPDFGVQAVLDRFGQIEPVVLFVVDGYSYGGKSFAARERTADIASRLPSLRRVVEVAYLSGAPDNPQDNAASQSAAVRTWKEYVAGVGANELRFEEVPFDHPLFIMYSSGTTGVPKCIVHGHGGTLIQHMKELMLHCDLRRGERLFYFTTCGWMMWNWLVSGLGVGAAIVLYDGNPAHPTIARLWEMAERLKINLFGTSPKFLASVQKARLSPGQTHDLSSLRAVLSTGAPLSEELFRWVYANVKADLQLSSISGGTDIISCFMLGNPILPVHAGEIQCRGLAMDVQAWDEQARPVVGQKGELVCASPFPSQPIGFWSDPDGRKYRAAYFDFDWDAEPRPVVWRHGDYVEVTETGGVIVYGRSDATLNPGGVRIGTAEIYRIVEGLPEVLDSLCVSRRTADGDEEIVLFVVLREGATLDGKLTQTIRNAIAAGASKRHVPRHVLAAPAIPYTISGKKVELAVQQILHGETVRNAGALANPQALDHFRGILPA